MSGALIVTAEIGRGDLGWLDHLRRVNYPAERNQVSAHLAIFHSLPPSAEGEARRALAQLASEPPPRASIDGLIDLDGGVAFRIASPDLDRFRRELAKCFHGLLSAQDSGGWRPHVTIQNKVSPTEARSLLLRLERDFTPKPLAISGLGLHRYMGGPWEEIASYSFRGAK